MMGRSGARVQDVTSESPLTSPRLAGIVGTILGPFVMFSTRLLINREEDMDRVDL
jgi:hypothetical protein